MSQPLEDSDRQKMAQAVADSHLGVGSKAPIVWFAASIVPIVLATLWFGTMIGDMRSRMNETITLSFMREYTREWKTNNPSLIEPNADEIQRRLKSP